MIGIIKDILGFSITIFLFVAPLFLVIRDTDWFEKLKDNLMNSPYRSSEFFASIYQNRKIFDYAEDIVCPACGTKNGDYRNTVRGCFGKKSIFKKQLCPVVPHMHVKCRFCHVKFMMWAK